jgi:hypothetical protein
MGVVLSAVFTWQSICFAPDCLSQWATRFMHTYVVVLPTLLLVAPVTQRVASRIERWWVRS